MDSLTMYRANLLRQFYSSMDKTKAKIEVFSWGWKFLNTMLMTGITLDYGEYTNGIPKYRFSNVNSQATDIFLYSHIKQCCNLCGYFDDKANSICAFNIDTDTKELLAIVEKAAFILAHNLNVLGIEPLVLKSGRGFHVWCRFEKPIENMKLKSFLLFHQIIISKQLYGFNNLINFSMYPNAVENHTHSLRLFGTKHIRTELFNSVWDGHSILDEEKSWLYFERYIQRPTKISVLDLAYPQENEQNDIDRLSKYPLIL